MTEINRLMHQLPKHPLFDALIELALPLADYAVFGSGPMWVRGIRESHDLDIIARGVAWDKAKMLGQVGIKDDSGLEYIAFSGGEIEVYHDWFPGEWDVSKLIESAELIDNVPFVRLDSVVNWKQQMGREKDMKDLLLVAAYLKQ